MFCHLLTPIYSHTNEQTAHTHTHTLAVRVLSVTTQWLHDVAGKSSEEQRQVLPLPTASHQAQEDLLEQAVATLG